MYNCVLTSLNKCEHVRGHYLLVILLEEAQDFTGITRSHWIQIERCKEIRLVYLS